jgi:Malectin domain
MGTQTDHQLEKSEVEALLGSGIFSRAPNLVQILNYACAKYFEGSSEEIKEYNIAVEALGRPQDFDQKRDSIVRVEAHRLRKRLREYYENEGANHICRIEIPHGQYAPRFVVNESDHQALPASTAPSVQIVAPAESEEARIADRPVLAKRWKWALPAAALGAGLIAVTVMLAFLTAARSRVQPGNESLTAVAGDEIRILAGVDAGVENKKYVDAVNHTWSGDRFFSGGSVYQAPAFHPIAGTRDPQVYQSRREGTFSYDIPLARGVYELRLHFGETLYGDNNIAGGGETSRIFQVFANGEPLLRDFDVIEEIGPSAADVKVFTDVSPAGDGKLHLKFDSGPNAAFLNGIEIVPGLVRKMHPVRMVSRERGFRDASGRFWESDRYVRGGLLVIRNEPVPETPDPELFRGERFGNLAYTIPVASGHYGLKLYFAERWFGSGRPGGGGKGSRVFDILCNGVALRRNVDIFKEAGGQNRAMILSFRDLEPNPQGKLAISLVPRRNYAFINAIEVQDESN